MSAPISFGELDVNIVSKINGPQGSVTPDAPFRIAVLGDFSGRDHRGIMEPGAALADRPVLRVDRDNIETILSRLNVMLPFPGAGPDETPEPLLFKTMEDFHPDAVYARLALFKTFQIARKKADDPRALAEALGKSLPTAPPASSSAPPLPEIPSAASFLDEVIDATETPSNSKTTFPKRETQWDKFLQGVVDGHATPDTENLKAEITSKLDAAAGDMMRALLHYPAFQSLEALWRGLAFLVNRIETDETLEICFIDIGKKELCADLRAAEDLRTTGIYNLLVEQSILTPGALPWSLLVGAYTFEPTAPEFETLGRMAKIARLAGAPFLSGAGDQMAGCNHLAQTPDAASWPGLSPEQQAAWNQLRQLPEAAWLGLALPGFLLRLPYGEDTDPTERFDFEEMPDAPRHGDYLWGNPAIACAYLIAKAYIKNGHRFTPGTFQDVDRLPLHVYKQGEDTRIQPVAEVMMTERTAMQLLEMGLMPLVSFKNQDTARLVRFQSISQPLSQLAGPWQKA